MRRIMSVFFVFCLIALSSCTKDRVCKCTGINGNSDLEFTFPKAKKQDAIDGCESYADNWATQYSSCEILE